MFLEFVWTDPLNFSENSLIDEILRVQLDRQCHLRSHLGQTPLFVCTLNLKVTFPKYKKLPDLT